MCFSLESSFGAAVILTAAGSLAVTRSKSKKQLFFSAIPLVFAIQQFSEGMVWLSIENPDYYHLKKLFTYFFLTFAVIIWPVWVPLSVYWLERNPARKRIIYYTLACGILFSTVLLFCLFYFPVYADASDYHIRYDIETVVYFPVISKIFYFASTTFSLLLSGYRKIKWLGLIILVSYIMTEIFFSGMVISVWCFFAAIASIMIIFALKEINSTANES